MTGIALTTQLARPAAQTPLDRAEQAALCPVALSSVGRGPEAVGTGACRRLPGASAAAEPGWETAGAGPLLGSSSSARLSASGWGPGCALYPAAPVGGGVGRARRASGAGAAWAVSCRRARVARRQWFRRRDAGLSRPRLGGRPAPWARWALRVRAAPGRAGMVGTVLFPLSAASPAVSGMRWAPAQGRDELGATAVSGVTKGATSSMSPRPAGRPWWGHRSGVVERRLYDPECGRAVSGRDHRIEHRAPGARRCGGPSTGGGGSGSALPAAPGTGSGGGTPLPSGVGGVLGL